MQQSIIAQVEQLIAHITSAAHAALDEYQSSGVAIPHLASLQEHPLDAANSTIKLKQAIRLLEGACDQLCTTLAPPAHTLLNRVMAYDSVCVRAAIELRIADYLLAHPAGAAHVDDIAHHVQVPSWKVKAILAALAARNCFLQLNSDTYTNNRLSVLLSDRGMNKRDILQTFTTECRRGQNELWPTLYGKDLAISDRPQESAFAHSARDLDSGQGVGLFDWLQRSPELFQRFNRGLVGWNEIVGSKCFLQAIPFESFPKGTRICELGAGLVGLDVIREHPHICLILQDLPHVTEHAQSVWTKEALSVTTTVQFIPIDFLVESPAPEIDVYMLRHVLHNWQDDDARRIVGNIARVMGSTSRLYIQEFVLPDHDGTDDEGLQTAPAPLLPGWGAGAVRKHAQNINMMCMLNAKERTYRDFTKLGLVCGLRLVKIWDLGEESVVEFTRV